MEKDGNSDNIYRLTALGRSLKIVCLKDAYEFFCSGEELELIWRPYFDLDTDYGRFISSIDISDTYLTIAAQRGCGIRILRQDLWEMIISFIISQRSNIKRIRKCIKTLSERFGSQKTSDDGSVYYDFPSPKALAEAPLNTISACGVGYRDTYISRTAQDIYYGLFDIEGLRDMTYPEAKAKLLKLHGVGEKVADCICLFGLHMLEAFPKDVHINRIIADEYAGNFPFEDHPGYAGVLQQYMFYYDLLRNSR